MTKEEIELDPDFTPEEHEEFTRLERDHPYSDVHDEKIAAPNLPENARDWKYDTLFLILFILLMALFLYLLLTGGIPAP